jgi:hypothetical protein
MFEHTRQRMGGQLRELRAAPGLPFSELLDRPTVERVLKEEGVGWRDRIFAPLVTLWVFLSQVLSADHSCREAVARLLAYRVAQGVRPCSARTGSYCKARGRLPEKVLARLVRHTGGELHARAEGPWLWKGRSVKLVDGSTVSMPDTPANQRDYPQPPNQKTGLGFPLARLVAVISLACGAVLDVAIGSYSGKEQGETALFRTLHDTLQSGDVVLGDRFFASYFGLAALAQRGVDAVVRAHQRRKIDWHAGRSVGPRDHVVRWDKPVRPDWMSAAEYNALPATLELRELRVQVSRQGFRTRELILVTTLLTPSGATAQELTDLYRLRWQVELDLRAIKAVMQMDVLRGQTPAMVRKEIWAHLLAYNLIRSAMAQAARRHDLLPRQLSFTGALQTLNAFSLPMLAATGHRLTALTDALLRAIASHRVGDRPNRIEPRAIKRRPKPHPLLTLPRPQARQQLLTQTHA